MLGPVLPSIAHRTSQLDYPIYTPPDTADRFYTQSGPLTCTSAVSVSPKNSPEIPRVPIIAPPSCPGPLVIKCEEELAEDRIKVLLTREREERESDGLDLFRIPGTCSNRSESESSLSDTGSVASKHSGTTLGGDRSRRHEHWTKALGMNDDFRKEVTGWILDARVDFPFMIYFANRTHAGPPEHPCKALDRSQ